MHTGPHSPSTQPAVPGGRGGGASPLLVGVIAFAAVFLLIVGGTIAYLVLRGNGAAPSGGGTTTTASASAGPSGTSQSASATPTGEVEEQRCWSPESIERSSADPSGKLRGGGLQFAPPSSYDLIRTPRGLAFMDDARGAYAEVEEDWYSGMSVGAVQWQPGVQYPGAEVASQKILSCYFSASIWGSTQGRSLADEVTEPVTVAGMSGYRTTATVNFAKSDLERTDATSLSVIVLETPQGPSAFVQETAVGVTEHEEAADEALETLTGIG